MNARSLLNIALTLAVIAAAAGLYFRPLQEAEASHPLIPIAAETLRRIEIQRTPGPDSGPAPAIVLERRDAGWRMTSPHAARLDEIALGRVLDVARLRSSTRMAAGDRARFELDKPWASIRFDQHVVGFGTTNALTQELYLASGEYVYAVSARFAAAVPAIPAKLLAHRMFAADEMPRAIGLERFALRHDGTRWQLEPADPGLSQDDLVRWVDQWRLASSVSTQPSTAGQWFERITVELSDGRAIMFAVTQRTPDLVLVREDEALAYHLPARLAEILLAPPNAPAAQPTGKP